MTLSRFVRLTCVRATKWIDSREIFGFSFHVNPGAAPVPSAAHANSSRGSADAPAVSVRRFLILLVVYFGAHVLIRTLLSHSADLDESDQLVLTQKASWGYGPQPPLYTWIQFAFFAVFGTSIFALALFKNLLLLGTGTLAYLNTRLITRSPASGIAAAASLFFIPQFAWESQRDLTNSVLASTLALATLFVFLRLFQTRRLADYLIFGICAGLGLLSKYNYVLLLISLLLTAACRKESRVIMRNPGMLLSMTVCLLCFLPNGLWILRHESETFRTASKFLAKASAPTDSTIAAGLASLAVSTTTFLGPFVLLTIFLLWKKSDPVKFRFESAQAKVLGQVLLTAYGLLVFSVLVFHVRDIRERYLQPILVCVPVLVFAVFQQRLDSRRFRRVVTAAGTVMVIVMICIPGRILFAERMHRTEPLNKPFDAIARQMRPALRDTTTIVADTELLAGNLRLNIPGKTFTTPAFAFLFTTRKDRLAFVWDASRWTSPPPYLAAFAADAGISLTNSKPLFFQAVFKYHHARTQRIGVIIPP